MVGCELQAWLTVVMWAFYPLAWILCEGLDAVSSDTELILYTILDVISKAVFGVWLLSMKDAMKADGSAVVPGNV